MSLLFHSRIAFSFIFFFFNDTATTEIYTLSLHDALPISAGRGDERGLSLEEKTVQRKRASAVREAFVGSLGQSRSEEHTSELQSQSNLVCRLLLEKKKKISERTDRKYYIESDYEITRGSD